MRTPSGTLLRCLVFASVGAALVVGCSSPDQPGTLPTSQPSQTSSSASPTTTPATPEEEVEAAVRAYYAELQRAAQSSDTTKLSAMVARTCPCFRAVKVINSNKRQGESAPGSTINLSEVRVHHVVGRTASAEVRFNAPAYDVIDRDGDVVSRVEEQSEHWDLSVVQAADDAWIIANLFDLEG